MDHNTNSFSRIRSSMQSLSELEKTIALYIIKHPEEIINSTLASVSRQCEVSETTVLRVCRSAGFSGFSEMKISLARDLSSPIREIGGDLTKGDDPKTILEKVFLANIQGLYDTMGIIQEEDLVHAVDLLDSARHILIVGVGPSGVIAEDLYSKLIRLKKSCSYQTDSYNQLIEAALLTEADLLVAVSLSGTSSDPLDTVYEAKKQKAKVICITGDGSSPIAKESEAVLSVVYRQPWIESMASRVTEFALLEVLYLILSIKHLNSSLEYEKAINQALEKKHHG